MGILLGTLSKIHHFEREIGRTGQDSPLIIGKNYGELFNSFTCVLLLVYTKSYVIGAMIVITILQARKLSPVYIAQSIDILG